MRIRKLFSTLAILMLAITISLFFTACVGNVSDNKIGSESTDKGFGSEGSSTGNANTEYESEASNANTSTGISSTLLSINGDVITGIFGNSTTTFSFLNDIVVSENASYLLAHDIGCTEVIQSKTVSLNAGDNIFYILVTNGNQQKLYTITIRRKPIYTVTFQTNTNKNCETQYIEEGNFATAPSATNLSKTGYTFKEWEYDFSIPITENKTINALWEANTYTITFDKRGGSGGSNSVSAVFSASMPIATAPTKEGYTFKGYFDKNQVQYYDSLMSSTRKWDKANDSTLYAKYETNTFTVTFNKQDGVGGSNSVRVAFGSNMPQARAPAKSGYTFVGYFDSNNVKYYDSNMKSVKAWDKSENTTLDARYDPITYTATFKVDGIVVGTAPFTVESVSIAEPQIPAIAGCESKWSEYSFIPEDITVNAIYYHSSGYTPIYKVEQLSKIALNGEYILVTNIDLNGITWVPIGTQENPFTGVFDGNGYYIENLSTSNSYEAIGFFGANSGTVKNLAIKNISFDIGRRFTYIGGLIGYNTGVVDNCSTFGTITIDADGLNRTTQIYSGGLVGDNNNGTITNSSSAVNISAIAYSNSNNYNNNVDVIACAGGLVGTNLDGSIQNCSATGTVYTSSAGYDSVGVCKTACAGGLVGENYGSIQNCTASGTVYASATGYFSAHVAYAGGLVGENGSNGTVTYCTASGKVSATPSTYVYVGDLIGQNNGTVN